MSWSAGQLRILRELGHEPMLLGSRAPERALVETASPAEIGGDSPRAGEAPSRPKAASAGALATAIARAAGGRDLGELALDLERLRREPALKRALWPRLRALRRQPR